MNRSETNFYRWLVEKRGYNPSDIKYQGRGTPDFTGKGERWEVKKLYGNRILLLSAKQEAYIEEGADGDWVAIMPENVDDKDPVLLIPCSKLRVSERIHIKDLKEYNLREKLISGVHPYPWLTLDPIFNKDYIRHSHQIYLGKKDVELEKWVERKIKEGKFSSWSHAYVIALTYMKRIEEPEGF